METEQVEFNPDEMEQIDDCVSIFMELFPDLDMSIHQAMLVNDIVGKILRDTHSEKGCNYNFREREH